MNHCLAKIYLKDDSKILLYFCDSNLIFKVKIQFSGVKFPLKMRAFFYQLIHIHQTCMDISL